MQLLSDFVSLLIGLIAGACIFTIIYNVALITFWAWLSYVTALISAWATCDMVGGYCSRHVMPAVGRIARGSFQLLNSIGATRTTTTYWGAPFTVHADGSRS